MLTFKWYKWYKEVGYEKKRQQSVQEHSCTFV